VTSQQARAFWVTAPGQGIIRDEPLPIAGPTDATVRTLFTGVSRGTESLVFSGAVPESERARMRAPFQAGEFPAPVKYGYCNVGQVESGPKTLLGRRVFSLFPHQTRFVVPVSALNPLPDDVPSGRAVLAANMETAVNGVWDAGRIRQVVSNLMGNAIQHGSPEAPIDLSVASKGTASAGSGLGGSTVVLSVHNEGVPIPPDLLPTIFDPLKRYATRESAAERSPGSIGLGLYIVREIVVAKGGTVEVASTAEEGTTFTVRIPLAQVSPGD